MLFNGSWKVMDRRHPGFCRLLRCSKASGHFSAAAPELQTTTDRDALAMCRIGLVNSCVAPRRAPKT